MIRYPNEAERSLGFPQFYGARNERNKNLERQVERMSARKKQADRSRQKQAAGYPFRDTAAQKSRQPVLEELYHDPDSKFHAQDQKRA